MFEVSKVNVHRGVFEWELEGAMPKPISWIGKLGPLKARLLAFSLALLSLFFTLNTAFATWLFHGFDITSHGAETVQTFVKWAFAAAAALVWLSAFLFRQPYAVLVMNRPQGILNLQEQTFWTVAPRKERTYKFEDVENIEVFSPAREPATPQGFVKLRFKNLPGEPAPHELSFRFLTQEQFQFFPTNLYKIIGREPKGDWNEDAELPSDSN